MDPPPLLRFLPSKLAEDKKISHPGDRVGPPAPASLIFRMRRRIQSLCLHQNSYQSTSRKRQASPVRSFPKKLLQRGNAMAPVSRSNANQIRFVLKGEGRPRESDKSKRTDDQYIDSIYTRRLAENSDETFTEGIYLLDVQQDIVLKSAFSMPTKTCLDFGWLRRAKSLRFQPTSRPKMFF